MSEQMPHYDNIAAIIPRYTAAGDTTAIIATNGSQRATTTRIRTVLNRLARSRAADLTALKHQASCATAQTILQPLSLAPGLVLCPIKLRNPRVSGDTSTGYINFHAVTSVMANDNTPYQSTVNLTGGTELPVIWTPSTVKRHLQYARLAMSYTTQQPEMPPELLLLSHKLLDFFHTLLTLKLK